MKTIIITILMLCMSLFATPKVGDDAVSFALPNLYNNSDMVTNKSSEGKVVLLNLWASWCAGCKEEMPLFVKLQKEYSKTEFEIVLSSIDNVPQSARDFLTKVDSERTLTSLYDTSKILPKTYRCSGMPSSFLIDRRGKIIAIYIGSMDDEAIISLKSKIQTLLGQ